MRKCPGVSGLGSVGTSLSDDRGREFIQASTCASTVMNSSNAKCCSPIILLKWVFIILTEDSQNPLIWGEPSGANAKSYFVLKYDHLFVNGFVLKMYNALLARY